MNDTSAPSGGSSDLTGRTLGAYHLIHRLGRGGMAEVFLAEQASLQRRVAVKILRQDLAEQADYVKRFHNEARAVAALVHANIVQIYEVGCVDGLHFIAQEYVAGQTVKQLVVRNGALPIQRVVSILRQIAAALGKASQGNIVHRDIKPENILLSNSGEAKVADFGLARVMDPQNVDLTQAGLTMGTPLYMSPEQVEGRVLDHRSDLYSCGVTAFFMLAGRPPFEGDTPLSVAVQHLQNPPPSLADIRPDAPSELIAIVEKLLAKKPSDRYANAADVLQELRALPIDNWDRSLPIEDETLDLTQDYTHSSQATQQLQSVMETQALTVPKRRPRWLYPLVIGVSCLVGFGLATLTWSGPLLRIDESETERLPTAADQFLYAMGLNTADAWQSVGRFHPPEQNSMNRYYWLRAQTQLGWLYLTSRRLDQAESVYGELSKLVADRDREFQAIGHAGLAAVYNEKSDLDAARPHVQKALAARQELPKPLSDKLDEVSRELGL